jgi:hypothetical protein
MRKLFILLLIPSFAALTLFSCKKTMSEQESEIAPDVLAKIGQLGFNKSTTQKTEGGYIVEGDIFLTDERLNEVPTSPNLRIAGEEQYHTFNLVKNFPRVIGVRVEGSVSAAFSTAVNNALARYNAENLGITFLRVSSGGNIVIKIINTGQYIASAGFPTSLGEPYNEIKYAKKYTTGYTDGFMTTVVAHELGHCIGFRHTDYMNRAYSCGSGGNEGASSVGAIHIPGTPEGPDAASWMLACLSSTTNRPFNNNDKIALSYLYK